METADVYGKHFSSEGLNRGHEGFTAARSASHTGDGSQSVCVFNRVGGGGAGRRLKLTGLKEAPAVSCRVAGGTLRRCDDAPSRGRWRKPFSLKPDIMQGSREAGRIKGEQSTGLENVLQTGR